MRSSAYGGTALSGPDPHVDLAIRELLLHSLNFSLYVESSSVY